MFFDELEQIVELAKRCGTAIFVVPKDFDVKVKNAIVLQPDGKSVITIEQVRQVMQKLSMKQLVDQYIVVRPAEMMNEEAANAFLKNLEEPRERVHFMLVTDSPSLLLPTILSRANIYFLRSKWKVDDEIKVGEKEKNLAKRLMVAKPSDLPSIADEITKKKDGVRAYTLEILGAAIEMLYRTYLISGKEVFLKRLPKFLKAYESIARNGHIKLHLVADLC